MIPGVLSIIHYSPCILFFIQHHPACENILYHNPKVIGRYKKRWSIVPPIPLHRMHQSRLQALNSLLNCSISLVFIFLCATNQARVMTLEGGSWFQQKFSWVETINWTRLRKRVYWEYSWRRRYPSFHIGTNWDKCTWESEVINLSRSSISTSVRFWQENKILRQRGVIT